MDKIRILLLTDEVWNDEIYGNNVMSNWFEGLNAEFANIYCSPGIPSNTCCKNYFQLTDKMMLKSIFTNMAAGRAFELSEAEIKLNDASGSPEKEDQKLYKILKAIASEPLRAIRDWIWLTGKYDEDQLTEFILSYNPHIIFSLRFSSRKILRLERKVFQISHRPIVAFTGDDEYSLQQISFSPIYWVRKLLLRRDIRNTLPIYSKFYTLSAEQKEEFQRDFPKLSVDILRKCANFNSEQISNLVQKPIKIIYAGRLYCNRWKSLIAVADALRKINSNGVKMIMEIYTYDTLTNKQKRILDDMQNSFLKKPVSPQQLQEIYANADIALHVESLDLKNKLLTRLSFSTKIIDCLASGCAVMAICWEKHSGYSYLKAENAAICISKYEEIQHKLQEIYDNHGIITYYRQRAQECGEKNHQKSVVQKRLLKDFWQIAKNEVR